MLRRSSHRLITTFFVVLSVLFSQLALASYACPGQAGAMAETMAAGEPCEGMDQAQPVLCHQHSAAAAQSFEVVKAACRVAADGRASACDALGARCRRRPKRCPPRLHPKRVRRRTHSSSPRSDSASDTFRRLTGAGAACPLASNDPFVFEFPCSPIACVRPPGRAMLRF